MPASSSLVLPALLCIDSLQVVSKKMGLWTCLTNKNLVRAGVTALSGMDKMHLRPNILKSPAKLPKTHLPGGC